MSAVHLPVPMLRGSRELNHFDMMPQASSHSYHEPSVVQLTDGQHNTYRKEIMNNAIQRPYIFKMRGCKEEAQLHQVVRRPPINPMKGLYPQVGWARHQKKGLASDPKKPTDLPLMPLANPFYAGMNNKIPQPK